jgi:cytidylate kinase
MSIITISRGTYSGGEELARGVAERLGWPCVSREMVLKTAAAYGVSAEALDAAMERRPPLWKRMSGKRDCHLILLRAALCEHIVAGNVVFQGQVAHLFLPGISHVISVRVIAGLEFRVAALMEHRHLSRKEAIAYIEQVDEERRRWSRFFFNAEWDDALIYDMVINLNRMSIESACQVVVRLSQQKEFQPTAASIRAMQDLSLSSRVFARLAMDWRAAGTSLHVEADEGFVTVSGTTHSSELLEAIPGIVRQVSGVRGLQSKARLLREGQEAPV